MIKESLKKVFLRDLNKLKAEIGLYKNESDIWKRDKEIKNSGGNLTLHLVGNLKYYIGKILGETDYKRDRESEFTTKNIPEAELLKLVEETINIVNNTLSSLPEEKYAELYPEDFLNDPASTDFVLIHLAAHLNYHLGQINYHRRLLA